MKNFNFKSLKEAKRIAKLWNNMPAEQKADLANVTDGYMTRDQFNRKWNQKTIDKAGEK